MEDLRYVVNHVFLPPNHPQNNDDFNHGNENVMLKMVLDALKSFTGLQDRNYPELEVSRLMVEKTLEVRDGGQAINPNRASEYLQDIKNDGSLVFHLRGQNAGLLLTRRGATIAFEAFELLAINNAVMACRGSLRRHFPDRVVTVPTEASVLRPGFVRHFADVLAELDAHTDPQTRPLVKKARRMVPETRNTVDPCLVTDMLMSWLASHGGSSTEDAVAVGLAKRSREEVAWSQTSLPWHRSDLWLLLRVSLRLVLDRAAAKVETTSLYKPFMAFFHAHVLRSCCRPGLNFNPALLSFMLAKTVRRTHKLGSFAATPGWLGSINTTIQEVGTLLGQVWNSIQEDNVSPTSTPLELLDFEADTALRLQGLDGHLDWINTRALHRLPASASTQHTPFSKTPSDRLPSADFSNNPDTLAFQLIDLECWMDRHFPNWVASCEITTGSIEASMRQLEKLMLAYYSSAYANYGSNPEALSNMYLIILEIWAAADKLAIQSNDGSLLSQYHPGFPAGLLHPLLLPKRRQMERLWDLERYIHMRSRPTVSAFSDFGSESSLAVRYFRQSQLHKDILEKNEQQARRDWDDKRSEYNRKSSEYQVLDGRRNFTSHERLQGYRRRDCHKYCARCALDVECDNISIRAYEWPLPEGKSNAQAVVFELNVPEVLAIWRNITLKILTNYLPKVRECCARRLYYASKILTIGGIYPSRTSDFQPASSIKPFSRSHYANRSEHISEMTYFTVCLNHGARYEYFYEPLDLPNSEILVDLRVPAACSYASFFPANSPLRNWVAGTEHTSNEVIAAQSTCPVSMHLDEFREFCHLRSGANLQWMNMLRLLRAPVLNLNSTDLLFLVLQAAHEAGAERDHGVLRESHEILRNEVFCRALVGAISDSLPPISKNAKNAIALYVLICLTSRLLSLTGSEVIRRDCLALLKKLRDAGLEWARDLWAKRSSVTDEQERTELSARLFKIATICHSTFDVDASVEGDGLWHIPLSSMDAEALSYCSILANSFSPTTITDPVTRCLMHKWRQTSVMAQESIARQILGSSCLDFAIAKPEIWGLYRPGTQQPNWQRQDKQPAIFTSTTLAPSGSDRGQSLSFSILTGLLLVDGRPLSRLPREYESHATYVRLFGDAILDVVPPTRAGMQFSTKNEHRGWAVHFLLRESRLVVVADQPGCEAEEYWEYIPQTAAQDDFPATFVYHFAMWLQHSTGNIEFRPLDDPWALASKSENWWLLSERHQIGSHGPGRSENKPNGPRKLVRGTRRLVDYHSKTSLVLYQILSPIESRPHCNIIYDIASCRVSIELPRYRISFGLRSGASSIDSDQYLGMRIDRDQTIGTLIGLKTKLVLCGDIPSAPRLVLFPRGEIKVEGAVNHVKASICHSHLTTVRHDPVQVDGHLGRLVDTGALYAKLVLVLLHAATSFCVCDPLTKRTGTEEALRILKSAAVKSFQFLDEECQKLLLQISQITTPRTYYPEHLTDMESISWSGQWCSNLSFLARHDWFYSCVQEIFLHAEDCAIFSDKAFTAEMPKPDSRLRRRAEIRNSTGYVSGFGAEGHSSDLDDRYQGRGKAQQSIRAKRAFQVGAFFQDLRAASHTDLPSQFSNPETLKEVILRVTGQVVEGPPFTAADPALDPRFSIAKLAKPGKVFGGQWCCLHEALKRTNLQQDSCKLSLFLAGLTFADSADWDFIQILMGLAAVQALRSIPIPEFPEFDLRHGIVPLGNAIDNALMETKRDFHCCPEISIPRISGESWSDFEDRTWPVYDAAVRRAVSNFRARLVGQWPTDGGRLDFTDHNARTYLNPNEKADELRRMFTNWWRNMHFQQYLDKIGNVAGTLGIFSMPLPPTPTAGADPQLVSGHRRRFLSISDLFSLHTAPTTEQVQFRDFGDFLQYESADHGTRNALQELIQKLDSHATESHQRQYLEELRRSLESTAHDHEGLTVKKNTHLHLQSAVHEYESKCESDLEKVQMDIFGVLKGGTHVAQISVAGNVAPRVSPILLLQQLARNNWKHLPCAWQRCIETYALGIISVQRARRLVASLGNDKAFVKEAVNVGHQWYGASRSPISQQEALLMEAESGIIIRDVQSSVAENMTDPADGKSTVMQLNMGEGKSSVIVPVATTTLADGKQLVRVVVGKPQKKQMIRMMTSKLGGLIDRRIFFMPCSRSVVLNQTQASRIEDMMKICQKEGGVLLVQPEHILSFKLMGLENVYSDSTAKQQLGQQLIGTQRWFESVSRDIVDESDENFGVKFELVYTMGSQEPIEMSPDRWIMVQSILGILAQVAKDMHEKGDEEGLEFSPRSRSGFPHIRLLKTSTVAELVKRVASTICNSGLRGFPIHRQPEEFRHQVYSYITTPQVDALTTIRVQDSPHFSGGGIKQALLLVRGLLAGGVLAFSLEQKRWTVDYGRTLSRSPPTMLAVPYRAHDLPSPRSEFSHPDAVIVLTCLTYYYSRLSDSEMQKALEKLLDSDQASSIYSEWVAGAEKANTGLDPDFKHLENLSLEDRSLCREHIFPPLRGVKAVIDFYLAEVVFPREMKQFPKKLSASGWDLARRTTGDHPLTGFSGTCDAKHFLPLSVSHIDLTEQLHTNAKVLRCLLRPENGVKEVQPPADASSKRRVLDSASLIKLMIANEPRVQVILDVGAQVVELTNLEAAELWLGLQKEKEAILFFDESDDLAVLGPGGQVQSFFASPFSRDTSRCLVYLDQAHTRGTDIVLPDDYRAAVTLGPNVTKDALVQACMRMRKLGHGQSVTFYVTPEIQRQIHQLPGVLPGQAPIEVKDVIQWAIYQTWHDAVKNMPLWVTQGVRHQRQEAIMQKAAARDHGGKAGHIIKEDVEAYLEDEAQSLEYRYAPRLTRDLDELSRVLGHLTPVLSQMVERCKAFGVRSLRGAALNEEQERELSPEVEEERQVERPPPRKPLKHSLRQDVRLFVSSGEIRRDPVMSSAILPAFMALSKTSCLRHLDPSSFGGERRRFLVTEDFASTVVEEGPAYSADSYQRPVHWVLVSHRPLSEPQQKQLMLILSPWEASKLLPEIWKSKHVTLHMYAPRTRLEVPTLEHLGLFIVPQPPPGWTSAPANLVRQLNLFAGQLYLRSRDEYVALCRYLGLSCAATPVGGVTPAADGFVGRTADNPDCGFQASPVGFLNVLVAGIRRDGRDIGRTHMGRVLAGELVHESEWTNTA